MSIYSTAVNRFAGKSLENFLKTLGGMAGGAVEGKSLGMLSGLGKYAEPAAVALGAATPLIAGLGMQMLAGEGPLGGGQSRSNRQPAFATQQYVPGAPPLTNQQMGSSLLDQQKFQHQLMLIQARQNAMNYGGAIKATSGIDDIMKIASNIYG